jgi:hypothetical protein
MLLGTVARTRTMNVACFIVASAGPEPDLVVPAVHYGGLPEPSANLGANSSADLDLDCHSVSRSRSQLVSLALRRWRWRELSAHPYVGLGTRRRMKL